MDGIVRDQWKILEEIKQVTTKYRKLTYAQTAKGDFVLQGLLEFSADEKGYFIEDAFEIKLVIPADYPNLPIRAWEKCNRIPKSFHTNPNDSLCLGTGIDIDNVLSDNSSVFEFVEQILIRYLFSFCVWEKTGIFPFGERQHGATGILESYQGYFNVKDFETAKRLLHYLSKMKRYSRNKWCPCKSGMRMRKCHGENIKKIIGVSKRDRFRNDYNLCKTI